MQTLSLPQYAQQVLDEYTDPSTNPSSGRSLLSHGDRERLRQYAFFLFKACQHLQASGPAVDKLVSIYDVLAGEVGANFAMKLSYEATLGFLRDFDHDLQSAAAVRPC